jgi:hypothetical protein
LKHGPSLPCLQIDTCYQGTGTGPVTKLPDAREPAIVVVASCHADRESPDAQAQRPAPHGMVSPGKTKGGQARPGPPPREGEAAPAVRTARLDLRSLPVVRRDVVACPYMKALWVDRDMVIRWVDPREVPRRLVGSNLAEYGSFRLAETLVRVALGAMLLNTEQRAHDVLAVPSGDGGAIIYLEQRPGDDLERAPDAASGRGPVPGRMSLQ